MSIRVHDKTRWLLVGATILVTAGCAADQSRRIARNETDCPMNFTLTCEVRQPGAREAASHCRCVRHKDINALLQGY
jgi:hypothetical protein